MDVKCPQCKGDNLELDKWNCINCLDCKKRIWLSVSTISEGLANITVEDSLNTSEPTS